jgi:SET domain-containing protein
VLLVDAVVGPSSIQGLGLIANQFVPKGTKVWVFAEGFDIELTDEQLERLSPPAREQALKYSYRYPGTSTHLLCGDDARFTNHSDAPNTRCRDDHTFATRDIQPGEEITSDYAEFDVRFSGFSTSG